MMTGALVFIGLLLVFAKYFMRATAAKMANESPDVGGTISLEILGNEVLIKTPTGETRFGLDKITKLIKGKNGYLAFLAPRSAHWVPFEAIDDKSAFEAALRGSAGR